MDDITKQIIDGAKAIMAEAKDDFAAMNERKEWDSIDDVKKNIGHIFDLAKKLAAVLYAAYGLIVGDDRKFTLADLSVLKSWVCRLLDETIALPPGLEQLSDLLIKWAVSKAFEWIEAEVKDRFDLVAKYQATGRLVGAA